MSDIIQTYIRCFIIIRHASKVTTSRSDSVCFSEQYNYKSYCITHHSTYVIPYVGCNTLQSRDKY